MWFWWSVIIVTILAVVGLIAFFSRRRNDGSGESPRSVGR
jgi:hypothetical protein